jgi:serine/threonine-protein kinase HipA
MFSKDILSIPKVVDIHFCGRFVGKLASRSANEIEFIFDEAYDFYALSPALSNENFKCHGLPQSFMDASPDAFGRMMINTEYGVKELCDYEYFVLSTDIDRQGAIRVSYQDEFVMPVSKLRNSFHLDDILNIPNENEIAEKLKLKTTNGTSVGGTQPKISATDDKGNLYLIKLTTYDPRSNVAFEATALDLAELCGITVEERKFVKGGNENEDGTTFPDAIIVKRFDREIGTDGKVTRIPCVSAKTILSPFRYNYASLAEFCDEDDKRELFKRALLNIMIRNDDDHEKNHAFLMDQQGKWKLSPLFDVVPFELREPGFTLNTDRINDRSVEKLVSLSSCFNVTTAEAKAFADEFETLVSDNWLRIAKNYMTERQALQRACCF